MSTRRRFIRSGTVLTALLAFQRGNAFYSGGTGLESKRPAPADRRFTSKAVEELIISSRKWIPGKELAWLFENCFPDTLDTTVDFEMKGNRPDTYVITGDIDAMWLRDSSAQVWPYLPLIAKDRQLQQLIAGVINRQTQCIHLDPYANAFYKEETKISEWKKTDITDMKAGIHERKWEVDSLCYPIRLAYKYWKTTVDVSPFDAAWNEAIRLILKTFREQQRKTGAGPYHFERTTAWATDGVPLGGYGYPVKPVGLICSMFRPSDDATLFPFLIPSNFFAVVSLRQAAEMLNAIRGDTGLANDCIQLANEVEGALKEYGTVVHPVFGKIFAYEVNGFGSYHFMDDANVPSLLSLPYLQALPKEDPVYQQTRKMLLSTDNPFFFKGSAAEGIGGPHAGMNMIWPLGIIMRALTSSDDAEIHKCLQWLVASNAGTGFMHESFHKDDPSKFTRKWFAWANTIFGELIMDLQHRKPALLDIG
jgi:meiotically up-regulated gene 157 (Mug157) protein